jgi:hypothetical protein
MPYYRDSATQQIIAQWIRQLQTNHFNIIAQFDVFIISHGSFASIPKTVMV